MQLDSSHTSHSVLSLLFRWSHPCSVVIGAVLIALASRRSSPFLCPHRCVLRAGSCLITENHHQIPKCGISELSRPRSILYCRHFLLCTSSSRFTDCGRGGILGTPNLCLCLVVVCHVQAPAHFQGVAISSVKFLIMFPAEEMDDLSADPSVGGTLCA